MPRDNLKIKSDPLDWRSDHIHTNFKDMYTHLRNAGYYVEVLGEPFTCFHASNYGTLLIVDPEEEFFNDEIQKFKSDILDHNLSVIIFADWYNASVIQKIKFYDENTRQWWMPDTGGANIPALNELLDEFGIALGDEVLEGYFNIGDHGMYYASGSSIIRFPQNHQSIIIERDLYDQGLEVIQYDKYLMSVFYSTISSYLQILTGDSQKIKFTRPILGMLQTSKALLQQNKDNRDLNYGTENNDKQNYVGMMDGASNDKMNDVSNHASEKNPIINKRILLKVNYEQLNSLEPDFVPADAETESNNVLNQDNIKLSVHDVEPKVYKPDSIIEKEKNTDDAVYGKVPNENVIYDKIKLIKPIASKDDESQNHGRIVIYGDSNCLDSTHMEKACFWLLDALLEFTMSSHVSNVLKDLSRSPNIQFSTSSSSIFPRRLPNNHLHLYSKVLMPNQGDSTSANPLKRPIPKCIKLWWDSPIFLNISASNDFYGPSKDDRDSGNMVSELNLRRKLESQKGEVRRC